MKKLLLIIACALVSCCSLNFNVPSQTKESQKFDINTTYNSVIKILAKDSKGNEMLSGSGFIINDSDILTAKHVCVGIQKYQKENKITKKIFYDFYASDKTTILESYGLQIIKVDKDHDICLMRKDHHGLVPVKFVKDWASVKLHSTVYVVGSPLGVFETAFEGKIILKDYTSDNLLVVDAASTFGNSGGASFRR